MARVLGAADYGRLAFLTALMEFVCGMLTAGSALPSSSSAPRRTPPGAPRRCPGCSRSRRASDCSSSCPCSRSSSPLRRRVDERHGHRHRLRHRPPGGARRCRRLPGIENKTADGAKIALVTSLATQVAVVAVVLVSSAPPTPSGRYGSSSAGRPSHSASCRSRPSTAVPCCGRCCRRGCRRASGALPCRGPGRVIGGLVLSRSEIFVMNWLAAPAAVGVFALAFGLAGHVFAPAQAFVGPLVPAISGLRGRRSRPCGRPSGACCGPGPPSSGSSRRWPSCRSPFSCPCSTVRSSEAGPGRRRPRRSRRAGSPSRARSWPSSRPGSRPASAQGDVMALVVDMVLALPSSRLSGCGVPSSRTSAAR